MKHTKKRPEWELAVLQPHRRVNRDAKMSSSAGLHFAFLTGLSSSRGNHVGRAWVLNLMPTGCRQSRRKAEGRPCPFSEETVPLNNLSQRSSPWKSHKELITPSAVWLSYLTTSFYCNVFYGYSHHFQALQLSAHLGASESAPSSAPLVPKHPLGSLFRSLLKATSSERPSLTLFHRSPSLYLRSYHSQSLIYPCVDLSAVFHIWKLHQSNICPWCIPGIWHF